MSTQSELQLIRDVVIGLDTNRVAIFAYTQTAFDNDQVDGVDTFDKDAEQNIPKATLTDYNTSVLTKGVRAQGASIPRMGWNHFVGRLSYNANKLAQQLRIFFGINAAAWAHNAFEYDPNASYATEDVCYVVETVSGVKTYTWYIRTGTSPEFIKGTSPAATTQWTEMQSKTSSSALLPFSAPGYRHKYAIADLTGEQYLTNRWYPITTALQDFEAQVGVAKEGALQVAIEAYCNGTVAGLANPHRAELAVLSKFTGFPGSSTDIVMNNTLVDETNGTVRDVSSGPIGFSKLVKGRQAVIWLKGGSTYALWNSFGSPFTLHASQYNNGVDDPLVPQTGKPFDVNPGLIRAKLATPDATASEEAPNLGQVSGAIPLPKTIGAGAQLQSVRLPGVYVVPDPTIANLIQGGPVTLPGPFELVVRGDKAGISVTTQQMTILMTGEEYTRMLAGNTVLIPWYLSGSPNGTAIGVSGLYVFRVINGDLYLYYRDGDEIPDFEIDEDGFLWADISE
jgi:hypothetical protein